VKSRRIFHVYGRNIKKKEAKKGIREKKRGKGERKLGKKKKERQREIKIHPNNLIYT
jgi:hypothetical protein